LSVNGRLAAFSAVFAANQGIPVAASRHLTRRQHALQGEATTMVKKPAGGEWLNIKEVRLVADLRIMHAKVHELFEIVSVIKSGHEENAIRRYSDQVMLEKDIQRVDEIYLWFVRLKEEGLRLTRK
jgi:hypothetical protein